MQQAINGMKSCFMYYTSATDIETFKDTMKPVPDLQRAICTKFPFLGDPSEVATSFVSLPFIAEYIEAKTDVPTTQGNPWQLVRVTPEQQQVLQPVASEFAVAIGLAERSNER